MPKFIVDIPEEALDKMREALIEDDFYDEEEAANASDTEVVEEMFLIPCAHFHILDLRETIKVTPLSGS